MDKIRLYSLLFFLWGFHSFAQEGEDSLFQQDEAFSFVEEGSFQSEISNGHNFDYSEIENPEFQEDPLWNSDDQEIDLNEPIFEESN